MAKAVSAYTRQYGGERRRAKLAKFHVWNKHRNKRLWAELVQRILCAAARSAVPKGSSWDNPIVIH